MTDEIHQPDRLSAIFAQGRLTARVFQTGRFCGAGTMSGPTGPGHLHLLRAGRLAVRGGAVCGGAAGSLVLDGPAALWLPRPGEHSLAALDGDGVDLVCAEIDLGAGSPFERALPDALRFDLTPEDALAGALGLLFAEAEAGECGRQAALDRLAELVVVYLLRRAIRGMARGTALEPGLLAGLAHPSLGRVLALLHEDPAADWTLERMADAAAMSRSSFAATFHAVVGVPPGEYLQGWRLQLARSRIEAGRTLKQTAREVGYASQAALSRALTRRFGGSARAFLRP